MRVTKRSMAASLLAFLSSRLFLVLLALSLLAASVFIWKTQESRDLALLAVDVNTKARSYASETESRYDRIYGALTRLASRGSPRTTVSVDEWKKDAAFYIDTFLGIERVAWVDSTFRIREIVPPQANDSYINKMANDIEPDPLEVNLWLPTYEALEFKGFILGAIGLDHLIKPIIDEIGDDYMLELADGDNAVYTSENWREPQAGFIAARSITLKNNAVLNLALAPTEKSLAAGARGAQNTLWFALLLSFIAIIAAAFAQEYLGKARSSELRYQSLFKSSRDAIFVTDLRGQFQDANLAATALSGFSRAELQQMTVSNLLTDHATAQSDGLPATWLMGTTMETNFRHKLGQKIPVELGTAPIEEAEKPRFVVTIARDITERKTAEAALRQYHDHLESLVAERTRALQEANAELESFSFSVSHDLRAPLRHIDGFVHLLHKRLSEQLDPTSQRYIKNVVDASQRMGQLIDDLLRFSRTSRTEMTFAVVDPLALIEQVRDDLQPMIMDRQITWTIDALPKVLGDPALLRVVWMNLIANAVKFTGYRENATIAIGIDPQASTDGKVIFFVRDNGVGFDPTYAHNLFGVFQRLHREDEFEGTGIGLATVRRIIHRHDGEIWAEAVEGAGATFFFTLRLAQ